MLEYSIITGVTGVLGSALAENLISKGKRVIGIGRKSKGFLSDAVLNNKDFIFIQKDIKDISKADFSNYKIENIFHLASIIEYSGKEVLEFSDYIEKSINLTLYVIKLAEKLNVKIVIYSSTMGVLGSPSEDKSLNETTPVSPMSNYNLAKYISEKLLELESHKNNNIKYVTIRFPAILSKNNSEGIIYTLKEQGKNNEDIELWGSGEYLRNVIYIDDAVDIMIKSVQNVDKLNNYELFLAGSRNSLKVKDIAQKILNLTKSKSKIILSKKESKNNFNVILDLSKAKKLLKFKPMTLEEGLKKYIKEINK